jgi:hypothetical protein
MLHVCVELRLQGEFDRFNCPLGDERLIASFFVASI